MGIAYRHTPRISVDVWSGTIEPSDAARHVDDIAGEAEWGTQGAILTDLSGIDADARPSPEALEQVATMFVERMGNRIRHAKWAIVADVTFEDATEFSTYIEAAAPRLIVFNDLATACAWLGIAESDLRPILEDLRRSCSA